MEIRLLAQQYGPAAIEEAARLMREAESEQVRIAAINTLLDRGYGRPCQPKQEFELSTDIRIESRPRDFIAGEIARIAARIGPPRDPGEAAE
jgi:hypothetical protein